jgi:hypothetical protein
MESYRIALLGLGTVGRAVAELLCTTRDECAVRAGRPIEVSRIVVRDPSRDREVPPDLPGEAILGGDAIEAISDPEIDGAARLALSFLGASQQAGGGWDYTPAISLRNDLSITGWQMLAIHAGIEAGILPSRETIASIERYLQRAIDPQGRATYSDRGRGRGRQGIGIDAVGLLSLLGLLIPSLLGLIHAWRVGALKW